MLCEIKLIFCICGDKWIGKTMVLLVLTLAFSNIFNLTRNKDTGDNDILAFPEKCCDVMELKVPGEDFKELRFYKYQDIFDYLCDNFDEDDDNYQDFYCNAVVEGYILTDLVRLEDIRMNSDMDTLEFGFYNNVDQNAYLFPNVVPLENYIEQFIGETATPQLFFANFNCGSNEAVLRQINGSFTKIDASISCKDEEDPDYTWVIVGSVLGFLALVGLVVWARKKKNSGGFEGMLL